MNRHLSFSSTQVKKLSLLSLSCAVYFFITIPISHLLQPELSFLSDALSLYALGINGLLLTTGFYSIALTQILLAILLLSLQARDRPVTGCGLLLLSGVGALLVAIFPTQAYPADLVSRLPHISGAVMQFLLFPLSLFILDYPGSTSGNTIYTKATAYLTLSIFFALLLLFFDPAFSDFQYFGLIEKIDILLITFWLIYQSYRLVSRPFSPSGDHTGD